MKYAVAEISGLQYRITEDQEVSVNHIDGKEGDIVDIEKILLVVDGGKTDIGKPFVEGLKVKAKILKQYLDDKVVVAKFKAKTGYRRRTGFRAKKTLLKIEKI